MSDTPETATPETATAEPAALTATDGENTPQPHALPALLLEDWTPLHRCLDWQLGQLAFAQRGAQAFTSQQVPNLINQGGLSAYRAAEVLFANCVELDQAGELEQDITCLEIAIGLGLFSLQLLDRFAALCREHGRDYYERLTWYASDGTPRMVQDAQKNGVFERHAGRVVLAVVDALDPTRLTRLDDGTTVELTGRLRAIFHTYLLCVLPANLFRRSRTGIERAESWGAVVAQTVLDKVADLPLFATLTAEQVQTLAQQRDPGALAQLVPLYPLLDLVLALAPFDPESIGEGPELRRIADQLTSSLTAAPEGEDEYVWVLHSAGAQHSLALQLQALRPNGFLLYRDYGPASAARANGNHLYQHYGATTAAGINHFALDGWLQQATDQGGRGAQVSVPPGEGEASIKTRLVSKAELPATRTAFALHFDQRAFERLEALMARARELVAKDPAGALEAYRHALLIERDNWLLLGEAGDVALRRNREMGLAQTLLTEALRINPWYAAGTWNSLGDLYWAANEFGAARQSYQRAVQANPEHWQGYLNLSDCCLREGDWAGAVEHAAQALARDVEGEQAERAQKLLVLAAERLGQQRQRAQVLRKARQAGTSR